MKTRIMYTLIATLFLLVSCDKESVKAKKEPKQLQMTEKSAAVIQQSNAFGIELFKLISEGDEENLMFSPLSASTALTMLLNGCNNETWTQINTMLGYDGMTQGEVNQACISLINQLLTVDPEVQLAIANAVFYRQSFDVKTPFLDTMQIAFDSEIAALDFSQPSALNTINGWASDNTNGKIPKVLDEISSNAVMFLMNALYFKGTWTDEFDADLTQDDIFQLADGSTTNVQMMHSSIQSATYSANDFAAIELTYGQANFSMLIMLPNNPLSEFIADFSEADWMEMTTWFDQNQGISERDVALPKFKFSYEKQLKDQLMALGMVDAFSPELADLSGISDADIYVDFVKQNTFIEVNEEGTEAAAVTTVGIVETSMPDSFIINRPFAFVIRERTTNAILFIGKVENPEY